MFPFITFCYFYVFINIFIAFYKTAFNQPRYQKNPFSNVLISHFNITLCYFTNNFIDMGVVTELRISVIMLTYNRENFLSRMIESILCQTFKDFEFIIVDNGSSDNSGLIADEYAEKDNRIRVIHKKRGNIGSGRNAGLNTAKGDYIAFIDDDDYVEPDFLEFLYNLLVENNAEVSICGSPNRNFEEKLIMTGEEAVIDLLWRKHYSMAFPTKMFSRRLANELRFSEDDHYDDISQMHILLSNANRVAYHGLPKYTFDRHTSNNSSWTTNFSLLTPETLSEYLRVYNDRTMWLIKRFPSNEPLWHYFEWSFMISMVEKIDVYDIKICDTLSDYMISELSKHKHEFLGGEFILDFEKVWLNKYVTDKKDEIISVNDSNCDFAV